MFAKGEAILNPVVLVLGMLFFTFMAIRIQALIRKKNPRIPLWNKDLKSIYKIAGWIKTLSMPLMAIGVIYFLFVILIFTAVLFNYIKTIFILSFSAWAILETYLSLSVSANLPDARIFRRIIYYSAVVLCLAGALFLFPKIIESYPYPKTPECALLDLPVRGEWLAGHAGATTITNAHSKNKYAIDCLKIGPDGRFYKEPEEDVTDFYSYNEPVFAPADGQITQVVDSFPSDQMGERDKEHPGGNFVILDIGDNKYFYVAHLRKGEIPVVEGQNVKKGTILGYIGNSGNTFFPHLHIHVQNNPKADQQGRVTYPIRFKNMKRKRLIFWCKVNDGTLIRNDRFHSL